MHHDQFKDINESLSKVHNAIMQKEMGAEGWDLRDDLLALKEVVADFATVVYQSHYVKSPTAHLLSVCRRTLCQLSGDAGSAYVGTDGDGHIRYLHDSINTICNDLSDAIRNAGN